VPTALTDMAVFPRSKTVMIVFHKKEKLEMRNRKT
jgi:hypothetical protein